MVRAFLAIDANQPTVVSSLQDVQRRLLSTGIKLRPVGLSQIHLTVKFFGEVSDEEIHTIVENLAVLNYPQFEAMLVKIGAFPNPGRARVIWVGFHPPSERALIELEREIHNFLGNKVRFDPKPFRPHITIARVKEFGPTSQLVDLIQNLQDGDFGRFLVSAVKLKKSVLAPQGPIYSDIHIFKLGGAA